MDRQNSTGVFQHKPLLGILTVADENRPFRGNSENFIDLIKMGKKTGVDVYVITTKDLILSEPMIRGYGYDDTNSSWVEKFIPLPAVLYNRIPFREDELEPDVAKTLQDCIKHPGIQLFNPSFFNKWTLFRWLKKSKLTRKYIPDTRKLSPKLNLAQFLRKHPVTYLKPVKGKAGKGIMQIRRSKDKKYRYELVVQENKRSKHQYFKQLSSLRAKIAQYTEEEPYIVQQGIQLAAYNDRPYDLRVLVQKNQYGRWVLTGIGARIAGEKSITTHVPRGGKIDDPKNVLTHSFGGESSRKLLLRTKNASMTIVKQIEKASGHKLGEMSLDLGIDSSGGIWFFEANAKPMKFDETHIREKSLKRILEYSIYLNYLKLKKAGLKKNAN